MTKDELMQSKIFRISIVVSACLAIPPLLFSLIVMSEDKVLDGLPFLLYTVFQFLFVCGLGAAIKWALTPKS